MKKSIIFASVLTKFLPILILSSVCLSVHAGSLSHTLEVYGLDDQQTESVSIPAGTVVHVSVYTNAGCNPSTHSCATAALASSGGDVVISSGGPGDSGSVNGKLISDGTVFLYASIGISAIGTGGFNSPSNARVTISW